MTGAQRTTLRHVADTLGVAVSTVSRALNDDPQISTATRERVRTAADSLGYVPDAAARSLAVRSSHTFGLMIPDAKDPMLGTVVAAFENAAGAAGYTVIVATSAGDATRERRALREFTAHRADGIALMGSVLDLEAVVARARPSRVVFLNSERLHHGEPDILPVLCLRPDESDGMRQVVEHLVAQGRRAFAFVDGDRAASGHVRSEALRRHVRAALGRDLVTVLRWNADERVAIARALVAAGADAVVGYDDRVALGLLDAFRSAGRRVPDDVAVVGFDDILFSELSNPRLTTVRQPAAEMGGLAVEMLLDAITTDTLPPTRVLPVELVVRESSVRS